MGKIIWLASYPKSGNTWLRVFLANYRQDNGEPVSINDLEAFPIASARPMFDLAAGVEASDLTEDEIERLRPSIYDHIARETEETIFLKVHDAYTYTSEGRPLLSESATAGAVYIIRNPLDVSVSFANHSTRDIDTIITRMADETYAFCSRPDRLHNQLLQRLLSWSGHVKSWINAPNLRLHVMRYEDMKQNPLETFAAALRFCGLSDETERVEKALACSSFDELQKQEKEQGFREKPPKVASFFRKGEVGAWREQLTERQIERIIADHGEVMRRFGYLDPDGKIIF
jgi:hypothetical protein